MRWSLIAVVALVGCGGKAATSPEAALQALLEAAKAGDASEFRAGFPSREEVGVLFECPSGVDLVARFDGLADDFGAWRDARPTIANGGFQAYQPTEVAVGEDIGGCTAKRAMRLVRADVKLAEVTGDKAYSVRFVDIDGHYRVLGF